MKTSPLFLITLLLAGCATIDAPLSTVESLPGDKFLMSSEAPLNSNTGSTAFMEAEASRRCNGGYSILSKKLVAGDSQTSADSIEIIFQCNKASLVEGSLTNTSPENITIVAKGNETVRLAQIRLNEFGYNAGRADGFLGARTKHALELFQSNSSLEITGRLDKLTQQALHIL